MILYLPQPRLYKVTLLCTNTIFDLIEENYSNTVRIGDISPMVPYTMGYCEAGNLAMTIWASDLCAPHSVYVLKSESPTGGVVQDPNEIIIGIANVLKNFQEKGEPIWIM